MEKRSSSKELGIVSCLSLSVLLFQYSAVLRPHLYTKKSNRPTALIRFSLSNLVF
jgi:hypothetical protein